MARRRTQSALIEIGAGLAVIIVGVVLARWMLEPEPGMQVALGLIPTVIVFAPFMVGLMVIAHGIVRLLPEPGSATQERTTNPEGRRLALQLIGGALLAIVLGSVIAWRLAPTTLWGHIVVYVPFAIGATLLSIGLVMFRPVREGGTTAVEYVPGVGYRSFVAWRYLLDRRRSITLRTKLALLILIVYRLLLWLVFGVGIRVEITDPLHIVGFVAMLAVVGVLFWGVLQRNSKLAVVAFLLGITVAIAGSVSVLVVTNGEPTFNLTDTKRLNQILLIIKLSGFGFAGLATYLGTLRSIFTFFTTVPIGGVWIGTAALVIVLAVMSGFETDLRDKILGSNAHIQVTKENGDFVEWREVKAKLDKIPGVIATTPYATSEVVIAANNNGMNVIIKGIDPTSVGDVTNLVKTIEPEYPDAINNLNSKRDDDQQRVIPQKPRAPDSVDPAPDDMPTGGDPIDFSGEPATSPDPGPPASGSASGTTGPAGNGSAATGPVGANGSATRGSAAGATGRGSSDGSATTGSAGSATGRGSSDGSATTGRATGKGSSDGSAANGAGAANGAANGSARLGAVGDPDTEPVTPYGGDARDIVDLTGGADAFDSDLIRWASGDHGDVSDSNIRVIELQRDPLATSRTRALPGILVGKELYKQTHLFPGQEVRVVSPLSDPSNPDATGTPIPFNRDYRLAGVFYTGMYEYDLKYVYVTLESLQDFLDLGDTVDGIEIRLASADDTDQYIPSQTSPGLIREALGDGYRVQDWRELNRSLFSALKLEKIAMFLVLGIVILVASFSIIGNLIMVVVEKAREIALLKTLGASDTGIMTLFAIQGMIIGIIGTVLGIGFGLVGCAALDEFGLPLDPDVYYINRLPIHVDPQAVILAAITGIVISIGATLYPALLAARVRPAAGMRH